MTDKSLKEFVEIENVGSDQYILGVNDTSLGSGGKVKFSNLAKSSISTDDDNLLSQGTDGKLLAKDKVGDLSELETEIKTDIVSAINDVGEVATKLGDITKLTTTNKNTIAEAVNEIDNDVTVEAQERATADNNLQHQIDAINAKTGVRDVVENYEALVEYDTSTLSDGDILKVLSDETKEGSATYYRWTISGTTGSWSYIGTEGNYYTKAQSDARFVPLARTINGKSLSNDIELALSDISDVNISDLVENNVLQYDGTVWKNKVLYGAAWGEITGNILNQKDLKEALEKKETKSKTPVFSASTLPATANWSSVAYGNGKFVAIATGATYGTNVAAYSEDGNNWFTTTMPSETYWASVCYGNGKFVAVSSESYGGAAYSTDGINWFKSTMSLAGGWDSVTYGNGKFIAINNTQACYSTDGIKWTLGYSSSDLEYWTSITYGNNKFVAISGVTESTLSKVCSYTNDGITWEKATLPVSAYWQSITYGNDLFVAVGYNTSGGVIVYSEDGINWIQATPPITHKWKTITYGDGMFVVFAYSYYLYSEDGTNWKTGKMPILGDEWRAATYGDGKFVANAYNSSNSIYMNEFTYYSTIASSSHNHILFNDGTLVQWNKLARSVAEQTVTLGYSYANTDYTIIIQPYHTTASVDGYPPLIHENSNKTLQSFVVNMYTTYAGFYYITIGQGVIS